MSSKVVFFIALVTLACHCDGRNTASKNQELIESKEGRILIEVPLIGTVLMVAFKICGLIMNTVGPLLFQYKLAAFTLIANVASWVYQNYFSVVIAAVVLLGYCVISGTFTQEVEFEMDHRLVQAARQLEAGALEYARIIN